MREAMKGLTEQAVVSKKQARKVVLDKAVTSLVRPFLELGKLAGELSKSNNYIVKLNKSAFYRA